MNFVKKIPSLHNVKSLISAYDFAKHNLKRPIADFRTYPTKAFYEILVPSFISSVNLLRFKSTL